jgi:hypothetical protein
MLVGAAAMDTAAWATDWRLGVALSGLFLLACGVVIGIDRAPTR